MAVGIRVRNASSIITIDDTLQNYALSSKGQLVGPATNPQGVGTASITTRASAVIAWQVNGQAALGWVTQNGANKTTTFYIKGAGTVLNYWVFDTADVGIVDTSTNIGMRIRRRTDGALVFDSRSKYMRVIDFQASTYDTAHQTFNYNYGVVPAVVMVKKFAVSDWIPLTGTGNPSDPQAQYIYDVQSFTWGGAATLTSQRLNVDGKLYDRVSQVPPGMKWTQPDFIFMAIDTTGL